MQSVAKTIKGAKSTKYRLHLLYLAVGALSTFAASRQVPEEDGIVLPADIERLVGYSRSEDLDDPVAKLNKALASGKVKLGYDTEKGYLPSVLKELGVPISSQTLVFSKTSSQGPFTSPKTPRALYFNSNTYVGWAQGAHKLDLAAVDPKKGTSFYTLTQSPEGTPKFQRDNACMSCHNNPRTLDIPGPFVRSVYTNSEGRPLGMVDGFVSGHNNPLSDRWGGWYVTGTHGKTYHLGNAFVSESEHHSRDLYRTSNLTSLDGLVDTSKYLSKHSDTVALMVLDHTVRMQLHLTKARYEGLIAADDLAKDPQNPSVKKWAATRLASHGEALLGYLLFCDEGKFAGPIKGTSGYEKDFLKGARRDRKGRSLRDFDLKTRLFKYPCSYLIYSESFDNIPANMKSYLWERLYQILAKNDQSTIFHRMSVEDRRDVFEILLDTKPEFKDWLRANHKI